MWQPGLLTVVAGMWAIATLLWLEQAYSGWEITWVMGATAWVYARHRTPLPMRYFAYSGALIAAISWCFLPNSLQYTSFVATLLWYGYHRGARTIWWLKPFLVAVTWVLVTMPVDWVNTTKAWPLAAGRLGLVWALAVGYDLLDMPYDQAQGVTTWPLRWGRSVTLWAALTLLWSGTALQWAFLAHAAFGPFVLTAVAATVVLLQVARLKIPPHAAVSVILKYKTALDSVMLLQAILLMVYLFL
jgi:4-hydroxybenzoate polyprenyltransferase